LAVALLACDARAAELAAPAVALDQVKITTGKGVDTPSPGTIVKDVCRPGIADEQKVIALFGWFERSVFMHDKYVRAFLAAGDNSVRLGVKNLEALAKSPVTVEYTWQEGPDWDKTQIKEAVQVVKDAASSEWKIKVAGGKIPRMKTLTVAYGAWNPRAVNQ
jgi:hypothetical protein